MSVTEKEAVNKRDLRTGPIMSSLLWFALPIIAGNLFTQFYNIVDSMVVGRFVSSDALAAVGVSFSIQMIVNSMFAGLGIGASVLVAQHCGAGNYDRMNKTIGTTFGLALLLGGTLTVVGALASRPVLQLMRTPDNILADASIYLMIVFLGSIGHLFYNMGNAVLRGLGDSRSPFLILVFCTMLNIALDLVFVVVFHWDVAGVALATIIAQSLSAVLVVWRITRHGPNVDLSRSDMRIDWKVAKGIVRIGLPTAAHMMISSAGMLVIQSITNTFGSNIVAANTIVMRIDGLIMQPMMGMGSALTTFVGQNLGAGKPERIREGTRKGAVLVCGFALVMAVPILLFGRYGAMLFTDNLDVINLVGQILGVLAFFYVFMGMNQWFTGAVRGAGAVVIPMFIIAISVLIRIPLAYMMAVRSGNYMGIYYSMNCANIVSAVLMIVYYIFGRWTDKAEVKRETQQPAAMKNG